MQLAETDQNIAAVIKYNVSIDKGYEILEQESLKVMKYLCPWDAIFTYLFSYFSFIWNWRSMMWEAHLYAKSGCVHSSGDTV